MKERPILFSGAMVRAILEGRKTQTRRVVKPQPSGDCGHFDPAHGYRFKGGPNLFCPYGQPGDRLWVREAFYASHKTEYCTLANGSVHYRADCDSFTEEMLSVRWTPSIHMPRWASRITLEIVSVRVERLNEISEDDVWAEGWAIIADLPDDNGGNIKYHNFSEFWESINGAGSWAANPWVWIIEFKRIGDV